MFEMLKQSGARYLGNKPCLQKKDACEREMERAGEREKKK